MWKCVFWHIGTAKVLISLHIWSGSLLSAKLIMWHYRVYQWRASAWDNTTHAWGKSESCILCMFEDTFSFGLNTFYFYKLINMYRAWDLKTSQGYNYVALIITHYCNNHRQIRKQCSRNLVICVSFFFTSVWKTGRIMLRDMASTRPSVNFFVSG